jgi:glycosyltransferase involved in cell wall biosynthesis
MIYGPRVDGWLSGARRNPIGRIAGAVAGIPTSVDLQHVGPCLFPSEAIRRRAVERWGLPESAVVNQGVDHDLFRPQPHHDWAWRILYVGRIDPRKGTELALRAVGHLPHAASFEMIGGGDERHLSDLRRLSEEIGLRGRVNFVSQVPQFELPRRYAAADAVVFPVLWDEPWGLVPLEAMAVGVPVVATGRGGSGEYLRDGKNCLIFDPEGGAEALATSIRMLAENADLRSALREGGFRTSRARSADDFDRAVESTLLRAVSLGGNGRS